MTSHDLLDGPTDDRLRGDGCGSGGDERNAGAAARGGEAPVHGGQPHAAEVRELETARIVDGQIVFHRRIDDAQGRGQLDGNDLDRKGREPWAKSSNRCVVEPT